MSDEEKTFQVRDRRSFNEDGERRPQTDAEPAAAAPVSPEPGPRDESPPDAGLPDDEPVRFSDFVASLATQAAVLLQGLPGEKGQPGSPDLRGARHMIAVLEMLADKTSGRLTEDEDRLVTGLLYELRMAYVSVAREASA